MFIGAVGCVEPTLRDATSFEQAVRTCAVAGRRLTSAELLALQRNPDISILATEWSGTVISHVYAIIVGGQILDDGAEEPRNFPNRYRCMTVPAIATYSALQKC